jgi:hypothetical protein
MARTRWPPGPVNPGLLPRPGRSDRQRRWVPKTGPGRQIVSKDNPSGVSRFGGRPGSRPLTIPPRHLKAGKAGPKAYPHPPCRLCTRAEPIDWSRRPQQILQLWAVGSILRGHSLCARGSRGRRQCLDVLSSWNRRSGSAEGLRKSRGVLAPALGATTSSPVIGVSPGPLSGPPDRPPARGSGRKAARR